MTLANKRNPDGTYEYINGDLGVVAGIHCDENGIGFDIITSHRDGKDGAVSLARNVVAEIENNAGMVKDAGAFPSYSLENGLKETIRIICKKFYEAENIIWSDAALAKLDELVQLGYDNIPVCMAKNQYSLSDDPTKLGRPSGFTVNIREVYVSAGAGFVVAITGTIMTMPGLPKVPAAENIDVDADGNIDGLF